MFTIKNMRAQVSFEYLLTILFALLLVGVAYLMLLLVQNMGARASVDLEQAKTESIEQIMG